MSHPVVDGPFIKWEDAFTAQELDAIEAHGDGLLLHKAQLGGSRDRDHDDVRITSIAWMEYSPVTAPFYEKLSGIVRHLNQHFYRFEITGLENLQYTVYHGAEGGHYNWHVDYGRHNPKPRKISMSLQLSAADSYDGCDLEFHAGEPAVKAPRARGTLVAFPAFFTHRVTPIARGTRKSLVCWAAGPAFR